MCPRSGISGQPALNQSPTVLVSISSVAVRSVIEICFLYERLSRNELVETKSLPFVVEVALD